MQSPLVRLLPWTRSQFPQVDRMRNGGQRVYLDNAAGTLVPQTVANAMADAALFANPQPGRNWPGGADALALHHRCRALVRDFLNAGEADPVFFSESTTASLYKLREALEPSLAPSLESGSNVVVTDCDHFANISAWEWRARWQIRRAAMLPDGHLDLESLASSLDAKTQVVALTAASNGLGTIIRLDEAIPLVRRLAPQATVVVDAVHAAPHRALDVATLGADAVAFSAYKLYGPNGGVLWLHPDLLSRITPYCVEPHTDRDSLLEWGTLNNVTVAGISAALEYLLRMAERLEPEYLGKLKEYPRQRRQFKIALDASRQWESEISRAVLTAFSEQEGATLFGIQDPDRAAERVPTFGFALRDTLVEGIEQRFWKTGSVQLAAGNHYSAAITRGLGMPGLGRASFAHYNHPEDLGHFLNTLQEVMRAE